jgi:putative MATE family efflux protein
VQIPKIRAFCARIFAVKKYRGEIMIKLYDKTKIDKDNLLFDGNALKMLLIPLMVEQLLNSLMGMIDTMMVSNVGSAAISAVSLVDSINTLVIQVFAALATGATIICSQYIGHGDNEGSNRAARQIVLTVLAISMTLVLICLVFRKPLLRFIFGAIEPEVMENAMVYFLITVISYPFIALFNAGSAFYRASGNAKYPMKVSVASNLINIAGNAFLIFGLNMGVAGAALATLASRIFCTVVIFYQLTKPGQQIVLTHYFSIRPDFPLILKILAVGVPSGIENGMFQFGKLAIQSTVSTLGTSAIAAQAMTIIFENVNGVAGVGIGIGLMTVVGQAIGAGRKEEAKYYIVKLSGYAWIAVFLACIAVFAVSRPVMSLAGMESESKRLCFEMITAITIAKPLVWVASFIPAYGMRAAGDVKFSMITATCTMWFCRVALAIFCMRVLKTGPMGVWIGMFADWTIRGMIFGYRFISGKWLKKSLI